MPEPDSNPAAPQPASAGLPLPEPALRPRPPGPGLDWAGSAVPVWVHPSQFPDRTQQDLLRCIQSREIAPKFLYDSVKQAHKWLRLHRALSPAQRQPNTASLYAQAATELAQQLCAQPVYVLGLGCGEGHKDRLLLDRLSQAGCPVHYAPLDASLALALTARAAALRLVPPHHCQTWVADLVQADDLAQCIEASQPPGTLRCITCFGLLPNFAPGLLAPRLQALLRQPDWLLLSANLAPGPDYPAAVAAVLPQYDNPLTRDWLMSFLADLGIAQTDGRLWFSVELDPTAPPLRRITAQFRLERDCTLELADQQLLWRAGQTVRVFVSYRHTPELVQAVLAAHGLTVLRQWVAPDGQEAVFLVRRV